jgi:tRNA (guanine26-N2/guanine27-N2)-dimethyltransferase
MGEKKLMKKVREGSAEIIVPEESLRKNSETFYNPAMEYQRDLTMAALRVYRGMAGKDISICDPLAGTGIRAVRMLKEVPGIGSMAVNDGNPKAVELIRKNLKANFPGKRKAPARVLNKNANMLFLGMRRGFDCIDIDPFGSPVTFLFNAGYALRDGSLFGITATDTGALCGSFPATCLARYGIMTGRSDFFKELGVRVLIKIGRAHV